MHERRMLRRLGVIAGAGLVTVGLAAFPAYTGADSGGNGNGNGNDNPDGNGNANDNPGGNGNGNANGNGNGNGGVEQVVICHVPPGNPDNEHTIEVGEPAVDAHVDNHGDSMGPCDADTTTTSTTTTEAPTTTTSTTTTSTTTTTAPIAPTACGLRTSGYLGTTTTYELGATSGTFQFTYNAEILPHRFDIFYEDVLIHTTGVVSGGNTVPVSFGPGTETTVDVVVTGPAVYGWYFDVSCPAT
jgi:hypothetical protein